MIFSFLSILSSLSLYCTVVSQDFKVILQRQRNCTTSLLQSGFSFSLSHFHTHAHSLSLETFLLFPFSLAIKYDKRKSSTLVQTSRRTIEDMIRSIDRRPNPANVHVASWPGASFLPIVHVIIISCGVFSLSLFLYNFRNFVKTYSLNNLLLYKQRFRDNLRT